MSEFILTETPAGTILVEIEEPSSISGLVMLSVGDHLPSFEDACESVKKNFAHLLKVLEAIDPDEIEMTCGVKVGAEGGNSFWGIAKTSGEANYEVKITWKADRTSSKS